MTKLGDNCGMFSQLSHVHSGTLITQLCVLVAWVRRVLLLKQGKGQTELAEFKASAAGGPVPVSRGVEVY